ncbi:MAG: ribosomal L7Ae/L30e/S12e/Gadd45 family protein [Lachnospiraceae bacterium]|nr:ribosomal L7Ae/L30e/S12e/Gadd45 family protein [Lachnospiraceae bacterium]
MHNDRTLSLLGLAVKAGKVVSGEFSTENSIKRHKAKVVIVAEDASDNTKKKFRDKCKFYKVPIFIYGTKNTLGHAMGKQDRSCAAVEDRGFAIKLETLFGGSAEYGENSDHEAD